MCLLILYVVLIKDTAAVEVVMQELRPQSKKTAARLKTILFTFSFIHQMWFNVTNIIKLPQKADSHWITCLLVFCPELLMYPGEPERTESLL